MGQLRVLSKLFRCRWLTCWPWKSNTGHDLKHLMLNLYGSALNKDILYADWGHGHEWRKAGYVLDPKQDQNFWWLEDPLCHEEIEALKAHGKLDRYVRVEPRGHWGFADACLELFNRAGITETAIKGVGGRLEWFQKDAIKQQDSTRDNVVEHLSMIKLIAGVEHMSEAERLAEVRRYVEAHLSTLCRPEPETK